MQNPLGNRLPTDHCCCHPLVSVIIPAYNAEHFIAQTLDSVLTQTYQSLEVLVVDDGSQDGTAAIVNNYMAADSRVKLLQQNNAGVAAARNLGIERSTGELIAPIDADDIFYPEHIEKQVEIFATSPPSVGLVYAWSVDIDEVSTPTGGLRAATIEGNVYKTLICHNFIGNASASMIRRSCLNAVGGYSSNLRAQNAQGCEDWDLFLRIAEQFEFRAVPTFSVGYRKLLNSMSKDYRQMARSHSLVMANVRQRYPTLPNFLFRLSASNLYFYFAHQSNGGHNYSTTLTWLRQAIQADPLTCWIRLGLYQLTLKSLWGWGMAQWSERPRHDRSTQPLPLELPKAPHTVLWEVRLLLAVGNGFHWLISALARQTLAQPQPLNFGTRENAL
ncbi:glycosyltransferase family A protein [Nodosilinea sp. E11]|uniref:glycosyltransferase family 2 protein n=1 Tax=Nodosilinea sp. E11 TaxID=3037479 RepID=UPI002935330C|nr:glycosyltransferase family A protein [Nodosilinea sp. E11]WOD39253.1 glycosyltransferase family A protein [Nodosilinea sp. E11]